jgi:1-acyl-sn-glycerol-3-phosphate acyltransferase
MGVAESDLITGLLPEKRVARAFLGRWLRRGVIAGFGLGFTVPYLRLLNAVRATGDELLPKLPRRNVMFLSNHQTYFLEAIAFFDLVYVRNNMPLESPMLRFSAAEETMKKNLLTAFMKMAGGVTLKRSFREGGVDVERGVDLRAVKRIEAAIRSGWLLHFPAGTTRRGAPLRSGVAHILHDTKAIAVPVRVDGFRELLLHKQVPGKLFKAASIRIHPPLDLTDFYDRPFTRESGRAVLDLLQPILAES